jgi:microcystin degradation protein MlrC
LSKKILIAGLFHETHTFVDDTTSLADFQIRRGTKMLDCTGDASPLGGVLEFGAQHDWDFIPVIDYRATPSGTVADAVLDEWWGEFEAAWPPDCDALYLVLHGAMVCESFPDVEGEVLSRIRILPGAEHLPIFGVYDLHANFSSAMAQHADCLVAYRENPHTDARESAVRAASLLARHLETGERPHIELRQLPIILPPTGTGTADDPMKSLAARARELESGDLWAINIAAGFAFADTPDTGVSLQAITTGDASAALDELESVALELKELGVRIDPPVESVMPEIRKPADGLTVLVEPSDNIGGGAPGDGTGCLRALISHRIENAAVCLNDPEAVRALGKVALGERITLALGGKGSRFNEGPLELEVELISLGDGRFELEDKQSHLASMCGDFFDMGDCAMVRHAGVTVLLTSNKTAPFDLGQWRSQGIDPEQLNVIVVKAAVAHRAAYDPIAARSFTIDTPGPCSSDLKRLPYGKIQRPIYPLDD